MEADPNEIDHVAEAANLPLPDRIVHKNWKVREDAYSQLADKFDVAEENAKIYSDFLPSLGKIVRDANAPAQLKGFKALCKYADAAPPQLVRRAAGDIAKGIVEKGLAGRPLNKNTATETFAMFIGGDAGDIIVDVVATLGFKHKTPKVVIAAVDCIAKALDEYGSIAVPLKPVAGKLPPLLNHAQEGVRNAAKSLLTLMHRWIGLKAVEPMLKDAKDVIKKEMEAIFQKNAKLGKPKAKKRTRAMEQRVRKRGGVEEIDEDDGFGEAAAEEEEVDLSEEINLMEKLAKEKVRIDEDTVKDWFTAIDSKLWRARKESLDVACKLIDGVRLIPVSHQEVFIRLRKIIPKDSNVNVVASASRLIIAMANGLKKNFPQGVAKALMLDLFTRLKEKNPVVIVPVCNALDELHLKRCMRFYEFLDEIKTASEHKVPKARCELLLWVGRCLMNGTAGVDLKGAPLKCFGAMFLKSTDDSTPDVRDAALSGLAALQKLVGERNVKVYIEKLDKKRKDKVASLLAALPDPAKVSSSKGDPAGPALNTRAKVKKRASGSPPGKNSAPKTTTKRVVRKVVKKKKKKSAGPVGSDDEGEGSHSSEQAFAAAAERFEGFDPDNWSVKSFKARAAAANFVTAGLTEKESLTREDISIVLGLLSTPPGLADSNFMALKPKLELFALVGSKCTEPLPRKSLKPLLSAAMEKLGDLKAAKITANLLMDFAEATSPRYFLNILAECVKETKNSRALIAMLKMAASVVEDFGIPPVPEQLIVSMAAPNLTNGAAPAKNGAVALACKSAKRAGVDKFRELLEKESEADGLDLFNSEIEKYSKDPEPATRKRRYEIPPADESEEEEEIIEEIIEEVIEEEEEVESEPEPEPVPVKKLVTAAPVRAKRRRPSENGAEPRRAAKPPVLAASAPPPTEVSQPTERISVAHEFAPGARILLELKNANWKKRQDALVAVEAILNNAHNFIKQNVGIEIITSLRARLSDSNRNLAAVAFDVVSKFVRAMGPGGMIHLKLWASGIFSQGLIENKMNVRDGAYRCLDAFFEVYGLAALIHYCPLPLTSKTSAVRKAFLEWLIPRLQGEVGEFDSSNEDLSPLIDPCLNCLRDRYSEVRTLADQLLDPVIKSVGIATVDNKVSILSRAARLQVEPSIEKYRSGEESGVGVATPSQSTPGPKIAGLTPRAGRERPRSVALPRTPAARKPGAPEDEETTPSNRIRPRPASARLTPVAPTLGLTVPIGDEGPSLKVNDGKEARAQRYTAKRMQLIEQLRATDPTSQIPPLIGEEIVDIASDLKECCTGKLYTKLTAPANRFKMHVDAIELVTSELEDNPDALSSVSDVLLRWAACRIEDSKTPPTVLIRLAGFVSYLSEVLMSSGVKLSDYESSAILPPIVEKVGSNREKVCVAMQSAILSINDIVDDGILIVLYTSCFRKPMTIRSHTEVSKEVCRLIENRCTAGMGVPRGVLPAIGKIAGGSDDGAGRAAAACLERAHEFFGDDLWALVGELTNEEAALLDERLTSVINGMKQGMGTAALPGEYDAPAVNGERPPEVEAFFAGQQQSNSAAPAASAAAIIASTVPSVPTPGDIRNEDFRLSVAPAPPSSVLTSISDSLNAATPVRTRNEAMIERMPETPALPRRNARPDAMPEVEEMGVEILNRLHSPDRDVQLSGLASIFENLNQGGALLHVDIGAKILLRLVQCFENTLERLENGRALEDDAAVLKSFLKGVIRFAREPDLLRRLDQSALQYLLSDALNAMIPQKVPGVNDWDQVRRGVNLMIVKVLESCDENLLFTALINLLLSNIRKMQKSSIDKMPALAKSSICIKSIAKVAKRGFKNCRINALLRDIHVFLKANPVRRDGSASSEDQTFAMRLLKTVVDAVVQEIGSSVFDKMDLIAQPEKSQLVQYIEMTLKESGHDVNQFGSVRSSGSDDVRQRGNNRNGTPPGRHGNFQNVHSSIGSGSVGSPVGVLHSDHQDSTGRHQNSGGGGGGGISNRRINDSGSEGGRGEGGVGQEQQPEGHSAGQVYLKRLHNIQRKYGLHAQAGGGEDGMSVEKENGSGTGGARQQTSVEEATRKAATLRERMAKIRELQTTKEQ